MVNRSMTSGDHAPRGDVREEIRLLGRTPGLTDAPAGVLTDLVRLGRVVHIRAHWALMAQGTAADKVYLLLDGRVGVRRSGADLGSRHPGEVLGELGILQRRLRSATVVSATEVTALHLDRDAFEWLHDRHPDFRTFVAEAALGRTA